MNIKRSISTLFDRPDFHEPVVDGIRAIAILWVFVLHVVFFHFGAFPDFVLGIFNSRATQWIGQGDLGVDLFFVISGFLIGTILLKELQRTGRIDFRRFYGRRFLRLIPVYTVVMILGVYFLRNIPKSAILLDIAPSGNVECAWANILYVNNFITIGKQYMGWCWSLAIEEQFYLIAPIFLLMVVGRMRRPITLMLLLLLASGIIRLAIIRTYDFVPPFNDPPDTPAWSLRFDVIYDKLHVRYAGLLAGVIGAYFSLYHKERMSSFFASAVRSNVIGVASLVTFWLVATMSFGADWFIRCPKLLAQTIHSHHRDIFSIAVIFIILIAIHGRGFLARLLKSMLSTRLLFPIAQLSYSVYLLHEMFMLWMFPKTTPWLTDTVGLTPSSVLFVNGVAVTILTFSVSSFLYVTVELPCMEFRKSKMFRRLFAKSELETKEDTAEPSVAMEAAS
jgi:peptidoglycan/LPS O-acetylase OafA/YrhL